MRYFLPTFAAAAWMPHIDGGWRWLMLAGFMGLLGLMLREIA